MNNYLLPTLAIIVPCYNEESILPATAEQLLTILNMLIEKHKIAANSFIVFIDDGSQDNTWPLIINLQQKFSAVKGIKLARNFGHQSALLSGLITVAGQIDCAISIDADLQDDISAIDQMITHFQAGYDIIYGVRKARHTDSFLKKNTALLFYKLMQMLGTQLVFNHADYRLISGRVLQQLVKFPEANIFLRGIFPLIGFKSIAVYYDRQVRQAGVSKYTFSKMFNFALSGITSLTVIPLRLLTLLGTLAFCMTIILTLYFLITINLYQHPLPHWGKIILLLSFMGSIQLIGLGMLGEYIGKIFQETKARPPYIIEKELP